MSIFSKLNPITWIKELLISDYVGSFVRHTLTAVGAFMVAQGLGNAQHVADAMSAIAILLTSPEFITGVISVLTGMKASFVNKKVL